MSKAARQLKDVVSRDVVYVNAQDTLREALDVMVENRVSAMPVVDARGHCVGVISVTDLLGMTKELADERPSTRSLPRPACDRRWRPAPR